MAPKRKVGKSNSGPFRWYAPVPSPYNPRLLISCTIPVPALQPPVKRKRTGDGDEKEQEGKKDVDSGKGGAPPSSRPSRAKKEHVPPSTGLASDTIPTPPSSAPAKMARKFEEQETPEGEQNVPPASSRAGASNADIIPEAPIEVAAAKQSPEASSDRKSVV